MLISLISMFNVNENIFISLNIDLNQFIFYTETLIPVFLFGHLFPLTGSWYMYLSGRICSLHNREVVSSCLLGSHRLCSFEFGSSFIHRKLQCHSRIKPISLWYFTWWHLNISGKFSTGHIKQSVNRSSSFGEYSCIWVF